MSPRATTTPGHPRPKQPTRVLAIASQGGHWEQLRRLRPAWANAAVTYVTTNPGYRPAVEADPPGADGAPPAFHAVPDANRATPVRLIRQALGVAWLVLRLRPDVVVTTGAAAGYFALRVGKLIGARTIWIDSIANADRLSLSGERAGPHADLWLTQWPHLATPGAPHSPRFAGAIL